MHPDLTVRGLSYAVVGLLLIAMLVLALISMRKEARRDEPLSGLLWFTLVILGLCTFVALSFAYQTAKLEEKVIKRYRMIVDEPS